MPFAKLYQITVENAPSKLEKGKLPKLTCSIREREITPGKIMLQRSCMLCVGEKIVKLCWGKMPVVPFRSHKRNPWLSVMWPLMQQAQCYGQ